MTRLYQQNYIRVVLCGVIFLLIGFVFVPTTHALTLIPPSLELALTPGQTSKTIIKLYNETQDTAEYYTEVRSFTAKGETGQPEYDFSTAPTGFSEWIQIESGPIKLDPGQRVEIPVTLAVPADAEPGGHYAAIFFSTNPPGDGQVRISSKLGTLLLGKVAGAVEENGTLSEFGLTSGKTVYARSPVSFFVRFSNTGNVHLRPTGTIAITNMFGKQVATVEVNPSHGATLPDSVRKYESVWEKKQVIAPQGSFLTKFFKEYDNEKNNFAFGKYSARVTLSIGSTDNIGTASVTFWMIPWHILLVWAIVLAIVIIVLIFLIKRYNAWILKKAQVLNKDKKN